MTFYVWDKPQILQQCKRLKPGVFDQWLHFTFEVWCVKQTIQSNLIHLKNSPSALIVFIGSRFKHKDNSKCCLVRLHPKAFVIVEKQGPDVKSEIKHWLKVNGLFKKYEEGIGNNMTFYGNQESGFIKKGKKLTNNIDISPDQFSSLSSKGWSPDAIIN